MKFIIVALYLVLINNLNLVYAQDHEFTETIHCNENSFFLVCRGTKQKIGFIAENFNLKDKLITHVGIGIVENGELLIYNVNNLADDTSALVVEKLNEFMSPSDLQYISIWEYRSTKKDLGILKKILNTFNSKKVYFDLKFNEIDNEYLYCSEFCVKVLKRANPKLFDFQLTKKKLDGFYRRSLEREFLNYYPVDFFQVNKKFIKIKEIFFN